MELILRAIVAERARINDQMAASGVFDQSVTAQEIQSKGNSFAARGHYLSELFLGQISGDFYSLAGRATKLAGQVEERFREPLHDVAEGQRGHLFLSIENGIAK